MKKITIKDIAKKCGVSPTTVSLVLNNKPVRTSAETKKKIIETAKKYNYVPSIAARSLVTKKTNILGLIVPDIENLFFSSLAKYLELSCKDQGYTLMIINSIDLYEEDFQSLFALTAHNVDGVFLALGHESYAHIEETKQVLSKLTIPYILIDRPINDFLCDQVYYNDQQGVFEATEYLINQGHRKIAFIQGPKELPNTIERYHGYCLALKEAEIPLEPAYIFSGDFHYDSGIAAAKKIIKTDVTAIFSSNDMMTLGCLNFLTSQAVKIPEDLSLISYDNVLYRYLVGYDITAVAQDIPLLSKKAFQLLEKKMQQPEKAPATIRLDPQLIERTSVKNINKK